MKLRVLSYNIHKGFSMNRKFVLEKIREAIQTVSADIVFLQEVQGEHSKHRKKFKDQWPVTTQLEYLADSIWSHHAYGKNAVYSEGHHGNAILSKFPLSFYENVDISTNRFERRGLLHAILDIPDVKPSVHLICIHLNLFEKSRIQQIEHLIKRIEEVVPHNSPLIIGGDFNDWRETISPILERELDVFEAFKQRLGAHARSFPSWLPMLPLDRIYIRGLQVEDAVCLEGNPWHELSDHNALYSELQIMEYSKP